MDQILVIDDDKELCSLLESFLVTEGFNVVVENDPVRGVERALGASFFMVVLDVMMPGMSGFDVLRNVRKESMIPVIMLTARGDDVDRIIGLELGADDYLPKPFNPRELVARIRAIQRRMGATSQLQAPSQKLLCVGDISLCCSSRVVKKNDTPVEMTSAEFSMLEQLLKHAGEVVTRDYLSETVLGRELAPFDRSVDVHISGLRKKLGRKVDGAERIRSVRGRGYQYAGDRLAGDG